ncbi:hypothetical protein V8G54_027497 [Vigna mungo]|uniref:Uncharacterized protein n=1 Tax=Vigna mungo TaxID=3915 RepID=A0AAQ3RQH9_VIGMU
MRTTAMSVLVYYNGSILIENNSIRYLSSKTAWVTITNTMTILEMKQSILNQFINPFIKVTNTLYIVELQYRYPVFISANRSEYCSCSILADLDVECLFFMATKGASQVQVEMMAYIREYHPNPTSFMSFYEMEKKLNDSLRIE